MFDSTVHILEVDFLQRKDLSIFTDHPVHLTERREREGVRWRRERGRGAIREVSSFQRVLCAGISGVGT